MTEPPFNNESNRAKMAEIMFETFSIPSLYVQIPAALAIYHSGRTDGVVVDSGHGYTHVVPMIDGIPCAHAIRSLGLAGQDLTNLLAKLLVERGHSSIATENQIVRDIKENLCYANIPINDENNGIVTDSVKNYELPDGEILSLGDEFVRIPEALFNPGMFGIESVSIPQLVTDSIQSAGDTRPIRQWLYRNVIISGGTMMFRGMADRMDKELTNLASEGLSARIIAPAERRYSPWIGGSIFATCHFQDRWAYKSEYDEVGPEIIRRKCT
ncbi:Actin/actin-like protein [Clavulina sp. PMI_390]|nr:Actin/actin-like protein [Clavulina sp. PMI_390]